MKTQKKHAFKHADPEKIIPAGQSKNETAKPASLNTNSPIAPYIYRDLKRTIIIISIFIVFLVALYLVQEKTELLAPILKKFGL